MKVFIVGDHRTGTGPANVTKEYINSFPEKVLYQKMVSKASRVPEIIWKIMCCDVVLLSGYSKQNLLCIKLAKIFKKPAAYLMHGCVEYENEINRVPDPEMAKVERATMAGVSKIFAVSVRFSKWLKEHYPEYAGKIDYAANGVEKPYTANENNTGSDSEDSQSHKGNTDNRINVFSIGGGMPRKMICYVCEAVKLLREEGFDAALTVAGDKGADTDKINSYDFVSNLGIIDPKEVRDLFKKSDVFIQNSCFETFGLAPVEALSNGCSILLSREVGALDIIESASDDDIINSYNDAKEIAEKIKHIINNPNAKRLLSGIDFDKYSWDARGKALCLKLQEMLKK